MTTADVPGHAGRAVDGDVDGPAVHALDGTWARDVRWWDVAFYVIAVLSAAALLTADVRGPALAASLTAIAVLVLAYVLWGALMGAGEWMTLRGELPLERVLEEYAEFVRYGLVGRAPQ